MPDDPITPDPTDGAADAMPAGDAHAAEAALASAEEAAERIATEAGGAPPDLPAFDGTAAAPAGQAAEIGLLDDVDLKVKIELGRTRMYVEDVLRLSANSVIELDKAAGDPVDIFVNERLVARGEVLVVNESFCVRVSEIIHQPATEG